MTQKLREPQKTQKTHDTEVPKDTQKTHLTHHTEVEEATIWVGVDLIKAHRRCHP